MRHPESHICAEDKQSARDKQRIATKYTERQKLIKTHVYILKCQKSAVPEIAT